MAISSSGKYFDLGNHSKFILIWEAQSCRYRYTFMEHQDFWVGISDMSLVFVKRRIVAFYGKRNEKRNASTTTTVIDSKNGSVPKSPGKVLKRTVTEDIVTTFSSPAAWLLVIALIITWSAVAVVMFDLVDYKNFSASSIAKIGSDPLKLVHDAVEETTDWIYGFFSLLSDIISSEGDEEDDDGDEDIDKVTHKEKEKDKEKIKEKEKPEKKATHKERTEKKEKPETKTVAKEEKKAKAKEKSEEKTKKETKGGKPEKMKQTAAKVKEVQKPSPKPKEKDKEKDHKEAAALSKHEQQGQSPAIPPPSPTVQASRPTPATPILEEKEGEKKAEKKVISETKKKEKEDAKKKSEKETAIDMKKKDCP
ncbi:Triadin [Sciurus carolinensis]|uniref:Triadin n=1 Tax=Sciurus carolinensis TaxID=30640 RepID=A0AA41MRI4_SCICA|nr:Triadin [Sciurus carolinensis]